MQFQVIDYGTCGGSRLWEEERNEDDRHVVERAVREACHLIIVRLQLIQSGSGGENSICDGVLNIYITE